MPLKLKTKPFGFREWSLPGVNPLSQQLSMDSGPTTAKAEVDMGKGFSPFALVYDCLGLQSWRAVTLTRQPMCPV